MISTPVSSTSDYYSSSDIEYDDDNDDDRIDATAQQSFPCREKVQISAERLIALFHHEQHHSPSNLISSTIKIQQSMRLIQVSTNQSIDRMFDDLIIIFQLCHVLHFFDK